jgi:hypothetical protein
MSEVYYTANATKCPFFTRAERVERREGGRQRTSKCALSNAAQLGRLNKILVSRKPHTPEASVLATCTQQERQACLLLPQSRTLGSEGKPKPTVSQKRRTNGQPKKMWLTVSRGTWQVGQSASVADMMPFHSSTAHGLWSADKQRTAPSREMSSSR